METLESKYKVAEVKINKQKTWLVYLEAEWRWQRKDSVNLESDQ